MDEAPDDFITRRGNVSSFEWVGNQNAPFQLSSITFAAFATAHFYRARYSFNLVPREDPGNEVGYHR